MNKDRLWALGATIAMIVIAAGGWVLGISPLLDSTTAADAQTASLKSTNESNAARLVVIQAQFDKIDELQRTLAPLRVSIPDEASASVFLSEVGDLGGKNKVTLKSVSINQAKVYVDTSVPVAAPDAAATDGAGTDEAAPAAGAAPAAAVTPVVPGVAADKFVLIPVTIEVSGSPDHVQKFIGDVQRGERLYYVTSLTTAEEGEGTSTVQASLSGFIFVLRGATTPAGEAAATPVTPQATSTPTPGGTPETNAGTTGGTTGEAAGKTP